MYAGMYFFHIIGLAIWFGAMMVMVLLLRKSRGLDPQQVSAVLADKGVWVTVQVSAVAVLLSGIGMIVQAGLIGKGKPLWLKVMEEGGGVVILVFVILATLWTRKLRLSLKQSDIVNASTMIKRFYGMSVSFVLAIAAVVLVVSLRLT